MRTTRPLLVSLVLAATLIPTFAGATHDFPPNRIDLTKIPGRGDFGGPETQRSAAYADVMGFGGSRIRFEWSRALAAGIDAPANWGYLDDVYGTTFDAKVTAAANEVAKRPAVKLWIGVGEGSQMDLDLVASGKWEARVRELVNRYKGQVRVWEAWNEPNFHYSAADYVAKVLVPFTRAVKAADPAALVIGGSPVEVSPAYWRGIAAAGGLAHMDIAGVHPYTHYNRSYDQHGVPAQLAEFRSIVGNKTTWNTESGFQSNGHNATFNHPDGTVIDLDWHSHADKVLTAWAYHLAHGIPVWHHFMYEGGYQDFDLIHVENWNDGVRYVKPAATAAVTLKELTSGRSFARLESPVSNVRAGVWTGALWMYWSTDRSTVAGSLRVDSSVATIVTFVDKYGARRELSVQPGQLLSFDVGGAPRWVATNSGTLTFVASSTTTTTTTTAPPDTTPPSVPQNLRVTAQGGGTVSLAWDPSTDNVAVQEYEVFTGDKDPYVLRATVSHPTTTVKVTGLTAGTTYPFRVRAIDKGRLNSSGLSNIAYGTA
jgi:hypothetical protein